MEKEKSTAHSSEEEAVNIGGVQLSEEQIDTLTSRTYPINDEGKVIVKYTTSLFQDFGEGTGFFPKIGVHLDDGFSQHNLTGMVPYNDVYNLTEALMDVEKGWSKNGNVEFREEEITEGSKREDYLQVALCPNTLSDDIGGVTKQHYKEKIFVKYGDKGSVTGGEICVADNRTNILAHEVGHLLGMEHTNNDPGVVQQFSEAGMNTRDNSIMYNEGTSQSAQEVQPFDQDLFEYTSITHGVSEPEKSANVAGVVVVGLLSAFSLLGCVGLKCARDAYRRGQPRERAANNVDIEMGETGREPPMSHHVDSVQNSRSNPRNGRF